MQINGFLKGNTVSPSGRHPLVVALAVIVGAECVLMAAASTFLIIELLIATPTSLASAIALTVLSIAATVWLAFIVVNIMRGSPWVRGATVVWQVLQLAVAVGAFQGFFARPDIGWLLLVPAVVVLVLLFTPPVITATSRREG
jgi:hypothetical protein